MTDLSSEGTADLYPKYMEVPIEQLDPDPDNGNIFRMEDIEALASSIKEHGFHGTVTVYEDPQERTGEVRYRIASGHRRYLACLMIGIEAIPCDIHPMPDEIKQKERLILSNFLMRKLTPIDMAGAIRLFCDEQKRNGKYKGRLRHVAAERFMLSDSMIYRYERLLDLDIGIQELINSDVVGLASVDDIAGTDKKVQRKLWNDLIMTGYDKISVNEVRALISKITGKKVGSKADKDKIDEKSASRPEKKSSQKHEEYKIEDVELIVEEAERLLQKIYGAGKKLSSREYELLEQIRDICDQIML